MIISTEMAKKIINCFLFLLLIAARCLGQQYNGTIPQIIEKEGRHTLLVDGKPFFMLGGQVHNSSGWPAMLPGVWSAAKYMHLNTIEIPIYWEQIEPQPGKFNFTLIDTFLAQSRRQKLHLVLLWFATWKNGSNHYMPAWMKEDAAKYPNITGQNGQPTDSPSPNVKATLQADIRAFTAVMKYLKQADARHTVIMVQVENETGSWGSVRDYSPAAQKLFNGPVPAGMLNPAMLNTLTVPVVVAGSWKKVFGDRADEYFQAWSIAQYVGQVAAAGKAVYPLPMYVNAALRDPLTDPMANTYESGGPTDNVIPIWKAAAPAIDLLAPDIYLSGSDKVLKVLELYGRPDNALFVPEAALNQVNAKYLFEVIAHGGIGFSPFGIDDNGRGSTAETTDRLTPFAREYATVTPMMRELAQWGFEGKIKAVVEHDDHGAQTINVGQWQVVVQFGTGHANEITNNNEPTGKMMIVRLDGNTFILAGTLCRISFIPMGANAGKAWQYLKVEEGNYDKGTFKPRRILNGDETDWGGPGFGPVPTVLRVALITR